MSRADANGQDQIVGQTADGVCVVGGDGKILVWNRAAERITGYVAREVLGRPCCDVFRGRDEHGNRLCYPGCQVATLVSAGELVESFDMRLHTKLGKPIWINASVVIRPNSHGGEALTVHFFREVTADRELVRLVHERLAAPAGTPNGATADSLTRRELDVIRLLAEGGTTRRIAETLHVSPATIRNHVQNILGKLGVHSRLEAVAFANRHRLL